MVIKSYHKHYFKHEGHTDWLQTLSLLLLSQTSQAHVTRVECNILSHKRVGVVLQATVEMCTRNKTLSSANAKYHYILPFFLKINKGDLPLMSSWVFWCDFINSINFFGEAMIKLCLWSEKSVIQRVFEPQTTFK